ncbi:MAG: hypothetical protein LBJ96_01110 [Holosporaceae bacterium]|nr:hypothetical protein [Holosporaceae bacterium]
MSRDIIRGCYIASVVLGVVCSGRSSEAMHLGIDPELAVEIDPELAVEEVLSVVDETKASDSDIEHWALLLALDRVDVLALFEGDGYSGGLSGKQKSHWERARCGEHKSNMERVLDSFITFREINRGDSREFSLLRTLYLALSRDKTKTDKESLHAALVCLRMLLDQHETSRAIVIDLANSGYFGTEFFTEDYQRWDVMSAIVDVSAIINPRSSTLAIFVPGHSRNAFDCNIGIVYEQMLKSYLSTYYLEHSEDIEYSRDIKFFATIRLLSCSNLSLFAAVFLANTAISDLISAMVFEYFWLKTNKAADRTLGYCPSYMWMPLNMQLPPNDPFLVATSRVAEMMLEVERGASYTEPDAFVPIFENAKVNLGLEVEDVVDLWTGITNSEEVRNYLTILRLMNGFLIKDGVNFPEICRITVSLLNGDANFADTRGHLSSVCSQRNFTNLLDQLSRKGIELRDDEVIEEYKEERGRSEVKLQELVSSFSLEQLASSFSPEQFRKIFSPEQLVSLYSSEQMREAFSLGRLKRLFPSQQEYRYMCNCMYEYWYEEDM